MPTLQFTVGDSDGPVDGQTKFQSKDLKFIFINFILVDNAPKNGLYPNPDYLHYYTQGILDISPNVFQNGNKYIIDYDGCKTC